MRVSPAVGCVSSMRRDVSEGLLRRHNEARVPGGNASSIYIQVNTVATTALACEKNVQHSSRRALTGGGLVRGVLRPVMSSCPSVYISVLSNLPSFVFRLPATLYLFDFVVRQLNG